MNLMEITKGYEPKQNEQTDQTKNSLGTLIAIWNAPSSVERQPNFTGPGTFENDISPSAVPVQILLDIIHGRSEFVK